MPYDPNTMGDIADHEDEENKKTGRSLGAKRKFDEFECPACSAHNPFDTFGNGDDVNCNWCGLAFRVSVDEDGTMKLKES